MPVEVQIESTAAHLPTTENIKNWVAAVLLSEEEEEGEKGDICVRLVDEEEGKMLNQQYRNGEQATNVLSFVMDVNIPEQKLLGDVVICAPIVAAEAREQNKSLQDHYTHLVVHGVLHLLGHDHQDKSQARKMETLEIKILGHLDIANPYETTIYKASQ